MSKIVTADLMAHYPPQSNDKIEADADLAEVLAAFTQIIMNERVRSYNEGLDAGRAEAHKLAEAPDDNDNTMRDDPMFNRGVQHVVNLLAKTLAPLGPWYAGDGSEDYDCDLEETLRNILAAKGLYDKDTGEFSNLSTEGAA